ncbi:hypothetical protein GH865_01395 [Rhodocyclus tenuis]|uniref:RHS repeat protein n=1 Tax=Rhodocyclus tenuis TaxID=1066 RepID=A0A6L5JV01_RHOTE|nr:hypothetical protein [Rhodocyclus gracilis]MQY51203.1 hypothetical protein [Rhodocyclus gracilis]MRD71911.1 hypothetical protein [Rhodocyclus gracilis]
MKTLNVAGRTETYTYDSLGRKKTETLKRRASPTNAALIDLTTSYDYDALDRIVKATDALGNEVLNSYDANGQLWKVILGSRRTLCAGRAGSNPLSPISRLLRRTRTPERLTDAVEGA